MKNLFKDTRFLDKAVCVKYSLSEEEMMEYAASALSKKVLGVLKEISNNKKAAYQQNDDFSGNIVSKKSLVLILCGTGNNGGDGYALARQLTAISDEYKVCPAVYRTGMALSEMCMLEASRAKKAGIVFYQSDDGSLSQEISSPAIVVDCVFGSGFHGCLDENVSSLMQKINSLDCIRIACDIPTGLSPDGTADASSFRADYTVTMGAIKASLCSDAAKDLCGEITCANLGVSREQFESAALGSAEEAKCVPVAQLLEKSDLILPIRKKNFVNKGTFGHAVIVRGEKGGAAVIAGSAALRYGAGLVTLVTFRDSEGKDKQHQKNSAAGAVESVLCLPAISDTAGKCIAFPELMMSADMPLNTAAVALGMGLGRDPKVTEPYFKWLEEHADIPCVIDADVFYNRNIINFIKTRSEIAEKRRSESKDCGIVLTPHPKEFQSLLALAGIGDYSVSDCVGKRIELVTEFCIKYRGVVLLVKGANPVIGFCAPQYEIKNTDKVQYDNPVQIFINPLGMPCLAKAGSGDVLSGLICSLLAQYSVRHEMMHTAESGLMSVPLAATVQASLAHALASRLAECDYAMTPFTLIDCTSKLSDTFTGECKDQIRRKGMAENNNAETKSSSKKTFGQKIKSFFKGFKDVSSHAGGCGYIAPHTLGKSPVNTADCKNPCDQN